MIPKTAGTYHIPVLLEASVAGIIPDKAGGVYVDATLGGGGHTREILKRMASDGRLFGFDQDADAAGNAPDDGRFTFVHANFRYLKNFLRYHGAGPADGVLADLGVSSHHLDEGGRGFSFRYPGEQLDMRMNRQARLTAAEVVQSYPKERLCEVFRLYGELKHPMRLAEAIVEARDGGKPISSCGELAEIAAPLLPRDRERKELAKVFQALRIEVNGELDALQELLAGALDVLKSGGRLAVITYHSLEDRLVKNFFRSGNFRGETEKDFFGRSNAPLRIVPPAFISPGKEEMESNPRSRSAKLRIAEKI